MAIIGLEVDRVDIPHEPGQWIEVRGLGWFDLEKCRQARMRQAVDSLKGIDVSLFRDLGDDNSDKSTNKSNDDDDDTSDYDRMQTLKMGLAGWSYEIPFEVANIERLDEATAVFAFNEILNRSRRKPSERKGLLSASPDQ